MLRLGINQLLTAVKVSYKLWQVMAQSLFLPISCIISWISRDGKHPFPGTWITEYITKHFIFYLSLLVISLPDRNLKMNSTTVSLFLVLSIALSLMVQNEAFVPVQTNTRMLQNSKRDKMPVAFGCKEVNILFCHVD